MLISAGPTHEPIDAVRYIGNRSSGRLGIALALEAARRGWETDLLLGPVGIQIPLESGIRVERFQTTAELSTLLTAHGPSARVIIMAAAVADFAPALLSRPVRLRKSPAAVR
jgi:phosphopantothenoylcysteine decarboxylase / phosphopantothenate---cysteine ligase